MPIGGRFRSLLAGFTQSFEDYSKGAGCCRSEPEARLCGARDKIRPTCASNCTPRGIASGKQTVSNTLAAEFLVLRARQFSMTYQSLCCARYHNATVSEFGKPANFQTDWEMSIDQCSSLPI